MKKKQKTRSPLNSTTREKLFYAIGNVGNCSWLLTSSFLTVYYTDSVLLGAGFMAIMMLVCRLFDGVSDLLVGMLVDKTHTKLGKARPWIITMMIPLNIAVFLMFRVPAGFSDNGKNIYAFVTYFLVTVVFYTATNISYQSLLPRFSLSMQDRNVTAVIRQAVDVIATVVFSIVVPIILNSNGGYNSQHAWSMVAAIFCMISMISYTICFFGIKEKLSAETKDSEGEVVKVSIKKGFKILLSNRYFYISAFLALAFSVVGGTTGVNIYFARDVLGNDNLYSLISVMTFAPSMLGLPFIPLLFKKFGKRRTLCVGLAIATIAGAVNFLNPHSVALYFTMLFVRSFASSPLTASIFSLPGDIVDYNEWKNGIRLEGLTTSANSIGTKIGTGLGSAILGWALMLGHYNGELAVQSQSALNSIIFCALGMPVIVMAIAFILMLFWNIEKYEPQVAAYMEQKSAGTQKE